MSNIVELPRSRPLLLEQAIAAFDAGDLSIELAEQFESLANSGYTEADYFLGCMYEDGHNGKSKSLPSAIMHYEKASRDIGYLEAYLAKARILYHGGVGIEKDLHRAREIYEMLVRHNQHPVACFMLGRIYQYGEGVGKNIGEAERLYSLAIQKGSIFGMVNLAMLYSERRAYFSSLVLRVRAGVQAFWIARRNPRDPRLRGG